MSKSIYDIDQAGNVLCTYTDADKENLKIVRTFPPIKLARHKDPARFTCSIVARFGQLRLWQLLPSKSADAMHRILGIK